MARPPSCGTVGAMATGPDPTQADATDTAARGACGPSHPLPAPVHVFPFDFRDALGLASRLFWAWPWSSGVAVSADEIWIRDGPRGLHTPPSDIPRAHVTGPYHWWKVIGPARMSVADGGVTFATNARRGVCLRFRDPVRGGLPTDSVRHPGVTVTVRDPEGLVSLIDTLLRPG